MEALESFLPRRGWLGRHSHLLAAATLMLALVSYLYHLDSWHMYDDEGGYLYAAWRISDGEMPYRDFLTPQAPVFLYIGAAVVRLVGPSAMGLRLATVGAMLLTAWLFYLMAKDTFDSSVALASLAVFLVHRNVYFMARFFRAEAYMVFFDVLGLYLGVQFHRQGKAWLAYGAGMAFALATLCKLFGLLPFAGYVLFLFLNRVHPRRGRHFWTAMRSLVRPAVGFAVISVGILLPFYLANPNLSEFLFGHHVRQGVGLSRVQVLVNGLSYYRDYVLLWPVYVSLAIVGAVVAWRQRTDFPLGTLFLAQLPTGAAFLLISRFLRPRLLIFLAPAGSLLMTLGAAWVVNRLSARLPSPVRRPAWAITGLLLTTWALFPHVRQDYEISQWRDRDTMEVARDLSERIAPDEVMLCDYPGLNFYAQRKSTYLGTGLSGGAVWGSQIRGFMLVRELESQPYQGRRWVVIDVSPATGHTMVGLHDYGWFLEYLDGAGFEVVDELARGQQLLRVYRASPQPLPTEIETPFQVDLGEHIRLLGFHLPRTTVHTAEPLTLTLYWRAERPFDADYKVFIHLVDDDGVLRAQEDVRPRYGRFPTYLWMPGPVIVDEHQLSLPPDLATGTYTLGVGLYPWPSGARLPAVAVDGARLQDDWIALPTFVTVR